MKSDNLTNQESRAYAITAYEIYKKNPEYAKELMFYSDKFIYKYPCIYDDESFYFNNISWDKFKCLSYFECNSLDIGLPKLSEVEDKEIIDQSIKDYADLIELVSKIDVDAAAYMLFEAYKLKYFYFCSHLIDAFGWHGTPQGHKYWAEINSKL